MKLLPVFGLREKIPILYHLILESSESRSISKCNLLSHKKEISSVNVITLCLAQSDYIKRLLLYF